MNLKARSLLPAHTNNLPQIHGQDLIKKDGQINITDHAYGDSQGVDFDTKERESQVNTDWSTFGSSIFMVNIQQGWKKWGCYRNPNNAKQESVAC